MDPTTPTLLAFDDVTIDLAGHRLSRGGIEQPLERKAFGVLALLAQTPGRVFARDDILDAVWGHHHVTPGVLNRVMTLLRHALGEDAQGARYLHTVHGVGYRFDLPETVRASAADAVPGRKPDASPAAIPAQAPRRRVNDRRWRFARIALWSLPLLTIVALIGWTWGSRTTRQATTTTTTTMPAATAIDRSIAVLPLANASRDPDQQFFSDGLSDNLIDALSRFEGLKVIGRMSSFRFRDGKDDARAIGAKLGAAYLVGGGVQRAGEVVRINASLTRVADGTTLWAEHYDRPYKDLFALQDEIARAIAIALRAKLLSGDATARQSDRPPSGDIAAYDAYLHGMQSFYRDDMRKVVEYQGLATRLDPAYASAWAQLGIAWTFLAADEDRGSTASKAGFRKARAAVDRALRLAPDLGIAHGALGNLMFADAIDWQGALAELRRGTELAPNNGQNQGGFSRILAATGHLHAAIEHRNRFLSIEPLFASNYYLHSQLMIATGQLSEAEQDIRIASELVPRPFPSHHLMNIAILRGDAETALKIAGAQPPPWREANLTLAAQLAPDRSASGALLAKFIENGRWTKTSPYLVAQSYALRGDAGKTVEWLERTWAMRDTSIHQLLYDPLILRFRDDPRLIAFCDRIGLPPPGTSEALSIDQIRA
ncbi:MAG: winged helix-turn-helix domain-containing protein, partial [Luteimonas sp.]